MEIKQGSFYRCVYFILIIDTCVKSSAIRKHKKRDDSATVLDRLVFNVPDNTSAAFTAPPTPPETAAYDRNVNPLKDQPNLSNSLPSGKDKVIRGSKKAVTLTKMEYLRKDWCKTDLFTQVIREPGCQKRRILNRFCYGQCNSFFVPKFGRRNTISAAFQSCTVCAPRKWSWISVTLRCPGSQPSRKRKRVQVVKQCKCMSKHTEPTEDKIRDSDTRT